MSDSDGGTVLSPEVHSQGLTPELSNTELVER
jgi:hypothetical protein